MSSDHSDQAMDIDSSPERTLQADTMQSNDIVSGPESNASSEPIDSDDLVANQALDDFRLCPCGCRDRSSIIMHKFFNLDPNVTKSNAGHNLVKKLCRLSQIVDHNVRKREVFETLQARFLLSIGYLARWGIRINFIHERLTSQEEWKLGKELEAEIEILATDIKRDFLTLDKEYHPQDLGVHISQKYEGVEILTIGRDFHTWKKGDGTDDEKLDGPFDVNQELKTYLREDLEDEIHIEFTPFE